MSFKIAVLSNLTEQRIEIIFNNSTYNINISCTLEPFEPVDLKVIGIPYQIILNKIDRIEADVSFDTMISSYMSIMKDLTDNQFYIMDFSNNKKVIGNNKLDNKKVPVQQAKNESLGK